MLTILAAVLAYLTFAALFIRFVRMLHQRDQVVVRAQSHRRA